MDRALVLEYNAVLHRLISAIDEGAKELVDECFVQLATIRAKLLRRG